MRKIFSALKKKTYFKEVMQNFERKGRGAGGVKKIDLYAYISLHGAL